MGTKFEGIISHIKRASEVSFLLRSDLIILVVFLFFLSDASAQSVWLPRGTPGHPPEKINIWTMLLWGQHVRVYKIKWGLKLISSSPWKSLQVLGNETTRRRSAAEGRWPPPRQIHNCFCFSKLNEPFYYYYYFYIAELGVRNCQLWHVRF